MLKFSVVDVLQHMAEWSLSSRPKLSNTCGTLSMIHDLWIFINLLEGPRSLKLIPTKPTILQVC